MSGRAIIKPSKGERIPKKKEVNYNVWTWYTFADGYRTCVRSLSKTEKAHAIAAHGAIVATSKERA